VTPVVKIYVFTTEVTEVTEECNFCNLTSNF